MRIFELKRKQVLGDEAWPIKGFSTRIDIELDVPNDMPAKAARRMALEQLRRLLEDAEPADLSTLSQPIHETAEEILGVEEKEEPAPDNWEKPDELDLRIVKSAHRVITEVAKRGMSGRQVLASELVGAIGLSAPTLGRLLRSGEPAHEYLARYLIVAPAGRTKALDLTPEGRLMASKIRAGVVPG